MTKNDVDQVLIDELRMRVASYEWEIGLLVERVRDQEGFIREMLRIQGEMALSLREPADDPAH
jgi:hypothetical protein